MSINPPPIVVATALLLAVLSAPAGAASPVEPAPEAPAADAVAADRPVRRSAVGRTIYTAPRDFAHNGSVSDLLRSLPFVEVDAEGEVSLRGDPDVAILMDGRSSIELSAGWRALTLQQLPAAMVESIEIVTNSSAAFPAGSARGVINIVTRKAGRPGDGR